jgi:hypothetical protein
MKGHKMIIDEIELVSWLGDVEHLPDEVFEEARTLLHAAIAIESAPCVVDLSHRSRRRAVIIRGGVATGVAAAAAAIAVFATSPGQSPKVPVASKQVASPLVRLADYVSGSVTPSGDAALVTRTTSGGGKNITVYDLYADDGQYFFSQTEGGLAGQVSAQHNLADGLFSREIAAAKLAVTGNVQIAAQDMADAPDPSHVISPRLPRRRQPRERSRPGISSTTGSGKTRRTRSSPGQANRKSAPACCGYSPRFQM